MKIVIILAFVGILAALFGAGVLMLRRNKGKASMAHALAWRVGLSVALFLFLMFSAYMGWIKPGGVPVAN